MRNASNRNTPNAKVNSDAAGTEKTSGKKLKQARLPFKIIGAGSTTEAGEKSSSNVSDDSGTVLQDGRKRKLSYEESPPSKENLTAASKKKKIVPAGSDNTSFEDIIVLEESQESNTSENLVSPNTTKDKQNNSAKKVTGDSVLKLQIKLPHSSSKNKRRKSKRLSLPAEDAKEDVSDSSDEKLAKALNPQKKAKVEHIMKDKELSSDLITEEIDREKTHVSEADQEKTVVGSEDDPTKENNKASKKQKTPSKTKRQSSSDSKSKDSNVQSVSKGSPTKGNSQNHTNSKIVHTGSRKSLRMEQHRVAMENRNSEGIRNSDSAQYTDDESKKKQISKTVIEISDSDEKPETNELASITESIARSKLDIMESLVSKAKISESKSSKNRKSLNKTAKSPKGALKTLDSFVSKTTSIANESAKIEHKLGDDVNTTKKYSKSSTDTGITSTPKLKAATRSSSHCTGEEEPNANAIATDSDKIKNVSTEADDEGDTSDDDNNIISSSCEAVDNILNASAGTKLSQNDKSLTPKQQKLNERRKLAREEKERKLQKIKEEKEKKLQEEKLQRQREKEEKELAKKKEREEKDEQRRKEREDKERKRLAEIEAKNEEKRKKDEAKDEERRKKDDERRRKEIEKEEVETRKKKAAEAFTKFFVAAKPTRTAGIEDDQESKDGAESVDLAFRPFQIKGDMKMAPLIRKDFTEAARKKLDSFFNLVNSDGQNDKEEAIPEKPQHLDQLYLGELKLGRLSPVRWRRTTIDSNYDEDLIIIEDSLERVGQAIDEARQPEQRYRAKFFSFHENKRPPFYGTWRKKTSVITRRRPFAQDKIFFEYEVDSDDEWEEEEPGESLNGSEDEKEKESDDDDYEVDNEWFVPHGHLSDEEIQNEDDLGLQDNSREAQKAKLKVLQQEFAQEMKKKTEKIKPRLLGCMWQDMNGNKPDLCPNVIWDSLNIRAMMFTAAPLVEEVEINEPSPSPPAPEKPKRLKFSEDLIKDLIRLVHGNRHSKVFLVNEYLAYVEKTSETIKNGDMLVPLKSTVRDKIDEISAWQIIDAKRKKNKIKKKCCWIVTDEILKKYTLDELSHLNGWSYTLQPKYVDTADSLNESIALEEDSPLTTRTESPANLCSNIETKKQNDQITKFTKAMTQEEKAQHLSPKSTAKISLSDANFVKSKKTKDANSTIKKSSVPATSPITISSQTPAAPPTVKNRVAVGSTWSVPRVSMVSPSAKNALISKFLRKNKDTLANDVVVVSDSSPNATTVSSIGQTIDGVVVID